MSAEQLTVVVEKIHHRGMHCIALKFPYNSVLISAVKKIEGAKFSKTHTCWYVEDRKNLIGELLQVFKGKAWVN